MSMNVRRGKQAENRIAMKRSLRTPNGGRNATKTHPAVARCDELPGVVTETVGQSASQRSRHQNEDRAQDQNGPQGRA